MFLSTSIRKSCFNLDLESLRKCLDQVEEVPERIQFDCLVFTCHCTCNGINKEIFLTLINDKRFDTNICDNYLLNMAEIYNNQEIITILKNLK